MRCRRTMEASVSDKLLLLRSNLSRVKVGPMHELSIAMSIVDSALEEAERREVTVDAVHLELGRLSGVVADALLFSYEMVCAGTPLEGSRLLIREVPIEVYCPACKTERVLNSMQWFCCPV